MKSRYATPTGTATSIDSWIGTGSRPRKPVEPESVSLASEAGEPLSWSPVFRLRILSTMRLPPENLETSFPAGPPTFPRTKSAASPRRPPLSVLEGSSRSRSDGPSSPPGRNAVAASLIAGERARPEYRAAFAHSLSASRTYSEGRFSFDCDWRPVAIGFPFPLPGAPGIVLHPLHGLVGRLADVLDAAGDSADALTNLVRSLRSVVHGARHLSRISLYSVVLRQREASTLGHRESAALADRDAQHLPLPIRACSDQSGAGHTRERCASGQQRRLRLLRGASHARSSALDAVAHGFHGGARRILLRRTGPCPSRTPGAGTRRRRLAARCGVRPPTGRRGPSA